METSGVFYAVLGRALSAGHPFGLASFFCLCEGTVHTSALCRWLLDSVKPVPNCKVMLLQRIALPVLKCCTPWLFWMCFYGQRISLCWAGGSCRRCPHQDTHNQAWLKASSRWAKPNWHATHKKSKTFMSQLVLGKPGLSKPRSLAWCPNSALCCQ